MEDDEIHRIRPRQATNLQRLSHRHFACGLRVYNPSSGHHRMQFALDK